MATQTKKDIHPAEKTQAQTETPTQVQAQTDSLAQTQVQPGAAGSHEFAIQRIYVKDLSFEAPHAPDIFRQDWQPKINLDVNVSNTRLADNVHEVVMKLTTTVTVSEKTAFLVEVQQAGIFTLRGFADKELHYVLGSFCPGVLFPYAREAVSDLVNRGGFPSLYLSPINFEALYQQQNKGQPSPSPQQATAEAGKTT